MESQLLHKVRELLEVPERTTEELGDLTGTLQHIAQTAQKFLEVARIGYEINQDLTTVEALSQKLQKHVADILNIEHGFLLAIYQSQTNMLDLYLQEEGRFLKRSDEPLKGIYQHVIETQQTLFIQHLSEEVDHLPYPIAGILETGSRESLIFVPLVLHGMSLGVLSIQHPQPYAYNQEDQFILELLANYIALALHNTRLYRSLYQLNEIGEILTQQLDSEQTLQAVVDKICAATRADLVILYPYNSMRRSFVLPPHIAGTLLDPSSKESMSPNRLGGTATQILRRTKPIFAQQSINADPNDSAHIRQGSFGRREQIHSTAAMPLRIEEEVVGVLFINFRQPQRFDAIQKLFIEGLAHYTAIAIKNARTFGTLSRRHLDELEILRHIDRELSRNLLDLKAFLNTLLKHALECVPAEEASILLYNAHTQALEIPAAIGLDAEARLRHTISIREVKGITRWVFEHKQPARVANVHRNSQWRELYIAGASNTISELDVPLFDGEEVIGVLNFESTKETAFSQQDEDFLITLAGQVVLAIKNAQAYEQSRREAQRFALWYRAEQELDKITNPAQLEQAYDVILRIAKEHSQSQVIIRRFDLDTQELVVIRNSESQSPLSPRLNLDAGVNGQVARERRTLVVHDTHNPPPGIAPAHLLDPTIRSLLITPIMFKDQYYGNLGLRHKDIGYFWGADITFFEGLAEQLAATIYRLETEQERQEFEQRISSLEIMSSIGQVSFELTHRWGNDLGLIAAYVDDIRLELEAQDITNTVISKKLDNIVRATQKVLDLNRGLKQSLGTSGERVVISPLVLLEETRVQALSSLPSNIQIELAIDDDIATIEVIYSQVADILRNLVTNAIQAMPKGGKITLGARNVGRFVILEVTDTGIGIPLQQQSKIFDLSFSTKGSSGFGLWSARTNALKNHGDLKVKSKLGQGTTFTLFLPRVVKGKEDHEN